MSKFDDLGLIFVGFWDRCFFGTDSKNSGIIAKDKDGIEHYYSYFELRTMVKDIEDK